jgi:hypothetical protein
MEQFHELCDGGRLIGGIKKLQNLHNFLLLSVHEIFVFHVQYGIRLRTYFGGWTVSHQQ